VYITWKPSDANNIPMIREKVNENMALFILISLYLKRK
jgi:hypothetical protein